MKVFIKRFWGFDVHAWPIVSFGQEESLKALLGRSNPGDLMAFVGTMGPETQDAQKGRLLGLAEFGQKRILSREALPPDAFNAAPKGPTGDIKWPHAVLITRAWRFTDSPLPLLTEVIGKQLSMAAISNAVQLSPFDQESILALSRVEFDVATTDAIRAEREEIALAVGPGGTMGPIPSSFTTTVIRDACRSASTYAVRFGSKNVWKIGWAHDPSERLNELNKHIPSEVLDNQRWGGGWTQKWASGNQAYDMEQRLLCMFDDNLKYGERVHCTQAQIEEAWLIAWKG